MTGLDLPPPLRELAALRIDGGQRQALTERVAEETPIALLYNGRSHVVMMATPQDLEDFALGFALTEGVVVAAGEFRLADILVAESGISIDAVIPQARFDALQSRQRRLSGRSGCGLCGVESLAEALRPVPRLDSGDAFTPAQIADGLRTLAARQPLNDASGGVHAAAFVHADGVWLREDVGRHNALDKVVGALARTASAPAPDAGFLAITSRASYEIVHKAASARIAVVAAISAPSALAVRLAEQAGLTLVAFVRGEAMTVYSHPQRIR